MECGPSAGLYLMYPKGSALLLIKELLTFLCNIFIPSGVIDSSNIDQAKTQRLSITQGDMISC